MSVMRRMSQVLQEKINAFLGQHEDPAEALDYSYQRQLEALQQVLRNVADVLTSEKRLELQAAQLRQSQVKLQDQARQALQQGREDLARVALTRSQEAQTKIGEAVTGLSEQMADVSMMVDRAQEKTQQMQARAAAIDQLVDTGVLDQIGVGAQDDIDRQLTAGAQDV